MSATPTRVHWETPPTLDPGSPLLEGNRVLESIAHQEALRALLAFSEFHEHIQDRRIAPGYAAANDLLETERFMQDEVLQLICDRAQSITQADGVVIALAQQSEPNGSDPGSPAEAYEMLCRAAAGKLIIPLGISLIGDSEFLQDCLETGRVLRCDNCDVDSRVELDVARALGARSTVLIPLRGRRQKLGVLQVFSKSVHAFTDKDVRCFDLFAELILSALKPGDQDRRFHWLSGVVNEVLGTKEVMGTKPAATDVGAALIENPEIDVPGIDIPEIAAEIVTPETGLALETGLTPSSAAAPTSSPESELKLVSQPVAVAAPAHELPEPVFADQALCESPEDDAPDSYAIGEADITPAPRPQLLPFPYRPPLASTPRPGLNVAMGLIAIAALFSAGAWYGMEVGGTKALHRTEATKEAGIAPAATAPPAPPAKVLAPTVADNLMDPGKADSMSAPPIAIAEDKLAALPKVTGIRHWSSSVGSTVVIDMQDQVPYEVHRLMSPERIYFDLHDTVLLHELDGKTMDVGDASLTRVRIAQPVAGVTRIVLDTKDGSNFSVSMESNPYRLVVELRNTDAHSADLRNSNTSLAPSHATPDRSTPIAQATARTDRVIPAKTGKFRIVLDAGHGGWDLGTVGRQGLLEKDLVLDVTERLGKLLQSRLGSEVLFTRSSDTYLPLDQRADIANQAQADLFVSVHANYSNSANARGVETYYTNLFSAPGAKELAAEKRAGANNDDAIAAHLTPVSLSPAGLHEKIQESQRLASSVQRSLYATLAASSPDIRNRGIKDSSFAVLTGTTMPAILTEISFVSSPADEHNLQSAAYRQQIAEALYQGIARYEQSSPRAKVAQLQTPRR
jgi:N-acetylmuramoyl-L-alanine amidase